MSSDTQSILAGLQFNNYISVAIATAVGYDYILTFPAEIEYVWKRSWSWVSTLFLVVRYVGCLSAMLDAFLGSTFVPGPVVVRTVLDLILDWAPPVFLAIADLLMVLRVYAMYNRSRIILAILLAVYIPTIVLYLVTTGIVDDPKTSLTVSNPEVAGVKFCAATVTQKSTYLFSLYVVIPRFILSILLCIAAVARFVRQSLQMHKAIKQWRSDRYMKLLVRESILYFFANLLYSVASFIENFQTAYIFLAMASCIFPYVLAPRFVISVRELYSHAVAEHVDTGFGVGSQRRSMNINTIIFASTGGMPSGDAEPAGGASEVGAEGVHGWSDDRGAETRGDAADAACA
ncbi:hypothetical protein BS17DRAFT_60768 [Gyrodon lividus]|nr:hypothetical protein BS17DRAFT_60768 [Gyrodon lividus]